MRLSDMPNIGKTLEIELNNVGIKTSSQLKEVGSIKAMLLLKETSNTCYNKLYAIEGAIQGVRWHYLSKEYRENLKKRLSNELTDSM